MPAPTLVQYNDGRSSNAEVAFLSNVTAGNFLVCVANNSNDRVTDSLANVWILLQGDFGSGLSVYYCPSTLGGANTVTASVGGINTYIAIAEFTPSLLQAYTAVADASLTSASLTGAANELLVGYAFGTAASAITGAGSGFTYESINEAGRIAMEYQSLSGAGSVTSVFTGTAANMVTGAFILSSPVVPLTGTPSLVQVALVSDFHNVTAGNTLIAVGFSDTSAPSIYDTLGNSWTLIAMVSKPIFGGSETGWLSAWICENCKGGADSVSTNFAMEFTPSSVAASSVIAAGTPSGNITSASISAQATQLLVGYGLLWGGLLASAVPEYQGIGAEFFGGIAAEIQPVVSNGSFTSAFTWVSQFGGNTYMTGVLALVSTYSISGNAGVAGATVSYSGAASGSVVAGAGGVYSIPGLAPGSYTITPSLSGYTFSPTSQNETVSNANITGVNFTATANTPSSSRFTFIEDASQAAGATTYNVIDGASTNSLGRVTAGSGAKVGQLFWDNIVAQAWSFNLQDNQPYIAAGSTDAADIESFATSLAAPVGITPVQPGPTPSTRFAFTPVVRRSGQPALQYLISDGPSIAYGSIGEIIWDGVFNRWAYFQTNAASQISAPNDVACITSFVSSLALISPNQISL